MMGAFFSVSMVGLLYERVTSDGSVLKYVAGSKLFTVMDEVDIGRLDVQAWINGLHLATCGR
jgi:hypothetical protein